MPQLNRVDQLPLPNLSLYSAFSGLALFYAIVYALTSYQGSFVDMLWTDIWFTGAVVNMGCCCFFLLAKCVHTLVFGTLQRSEQQDMRDKFWNFVFYKFIFVFGVLNVQEIPEMMCWCVWFAVLGTLLLSEQLSKDRFQFLSFSPNTPTSSHAKIILLLSFILLSCAGLFMVCAVVGWQYGFNHFTFLYSEVFIVFAKTLHSIIRHIIHLWDMHHEGVWENRSTYTYYTELVLELAVLCVDFLHHVHMLLWANMFLSVASLILLMKLRFLYQEIQRRLKRHRNYTLVCETLENRFVQVPSHELLLSDEKCAICWEKMNSACKLPCGHIFHMVCLRAWLEQDTVCPTCRISLSDDLQQTGRRGNDQRQDREGVASGGGGGRRRRLQRNIRNAHNWLFRFNGASIASWLPNFSVELHHEDPRWVNDAAELHRVAQQVQSMFPHVPLQAITLDLVDTHSVPLTVDRILSHSIYIPGQEAVDNGQDSSESDDEDNEDGEEMEEMREEEDVEMLGPLLETPQSSSSEEEDEGDEQESVLVGGNENLRLSSLVEGSNAGGDLFLGGGEGLERGRVVLRNEEEEASLACSSILTGDDCSVRSGEMAPAAGLASSSVGSKLAQSLTHIPDYSEVRHETVPCPQPPDSLRQRVLESSSSFQPGGASVSSGSPRGTRRILKEKESEKSTSAVFFTSLQERKAELLQKARRRYLAKELSNS